MVCARRELRRETGLLIDPGRCVFVIELLPPDGERMLDLVFLSPGRPAGRPSTIRGRAATRGRRLIAGRCPVPASTRGRASAGPAQARRLQRRPVPSTRVGRPAHDQVLTSDGIGKPQRWATTAVARPSRAASSTSRQEGTCAPCPTSRSVAAGRCDVGPVRRRRRSWPPSRSRTPPCSTSGSTLGRRGRAGAAPRSRPR